MSCDYHMLVSHRRLMQIDQETKRTINIPFLGNAEKEAIMREKYLATMKPVSHCFWNVSLLLINLLSLPSFFSFSPFSLSFPPSPPSLPFSPPSPLPFLSPSSAPLGAGTSRCHDLPTCGDSQREELPGPVRGDHQQCPAEAAQSCELRQPSHSLGALQGGEGV